MRKEGRLHYPEDDDEIHRFFGDSTQGFLEIKLTSNQQ
jgi:hypothetical protein